jgi:glycosyltransferase involved in cell wall biosynthesis
MNKLSKVSIVMPAYNAEETIVESIQSVLSQTYSNFEIIIVDDGSSDGTTTLVNSIFSDSRIILKEIANSGVANARNTGMRQATGEYIAFLDSDDVWDSGFLAACIQAFNEKDNIRVVYTHYKIFKSNVNQNINGLQNRYKFIPHSLYRIMIYDYIPTSASMIKRSVVLDGDFFDMRFFGTEDWEFWIRIISKYDIHYISEPLVYYREHSKGISKNKLRQNKNCYKVVLNTLKTYSIPYLVRYLMLWEFHRSNILSHLSVGNYKIGLCGTVKMILKNPLFIPSYLFLFHAILRRQKQRMVE